MTVRELKFLLMLQLMKTFRVTFYDEFEAESEEGAEQKLRDYLESLCDTIGHIPIDIEAFEFEEIEDEQSQ